MHISAVQSNLVWEDIDANLNAFERKINAIHSSPDLIILPEMFSTGFSMNPGPLAENPDGKTTRWMKGMAEKSNAVITGTLIILEKGRFFNRLLWMQPDGNCFSYDKKHLFSIVGENKIYTAGNSKLIVGLKGWKICPLICYDLRFPVWCRNKFKDGNYEYDLLIFVANWPQIRSHPWKTLLAARAMENLSFVAGVNRVGEDGNKIPHSGDTQVIDPTGKVLCQNESPEEFTCHVTLEAEALKKIRRNFSVGPDWDHFTITVNS